MSETTCPNCHAELSADAPHGLCPRCLLHQVLDGDDAPVQAGDRLRYFGDYELVEEIGRGGMGVVYKARQVSLERVVALKWILSGPHSSESQLERFRREATTLAQLDHPGIVAVHEVGEHEGQPYFSMDYVEGPSLAQLVSQGPLAIARAAGYVAAVAEAVSFAHERGVMHRDLKPSNILVDTGDRIQVTDFGLAKRLGEGAALTLSGTFLGTPEYMAPEQVRGAEIGPGTDVYALGVLLYELLTGQVPLRGSGALETARWVLEKEPEPPRQRRPSIHRDLEAVCMKCLEKLPDRRYGSVREVAEDLGRFLEGEGVKARPVRAAERMWRNLRRRPWAAAAVCAILLVLVLALADAGRRRAALVEEARSERLEGRRGDALAKLKSAGRWAPWGNDPARLREEAVLALALPAATHRHRLPFGSARGLALSHDGRFAAAAGFWLGQSPRGHFKKDIVIWDADTGRELDLFVSDDVPLAFSPSGPWFLVSDSTFRLERTPDSEGIMTTMKGVELESVMMWDPSHRREVSRLELAEPGTQGHFSAWVFHPEENLAVRGDGGVVRAWNFDHGSVVTWPVTGTPIAFSSAQELLVLHRRSREVRRWHRRRKTLDVLAGNVAAAGPHGAFLERGDRTEVLDLRRGALLTTLPFPVTSPLQVAFSHDGRYLAATDQAYGMVSDANIGIWTRVDEGSQLQRITTLSVPPADRVSLGRATFQPGGSILATTAGEAGAGLVILWDVETPREIARLREGQHHPVWSASGRRLATLGGGEIEIDGPNSTMNSMSDIDGIQVGNSVVNVWDVHSGPPTYPSAEPVRTLSLSPDAGRLAVNAGLWTWRTTQLGPRLDRTRSDLGSEQALFDGTGDLWSVSQVPVPEQVSEESRPFLVLARSSSGHTLRLASPDYSGVDLQGEFTFPGSGGPQSRGRPSGVRPQPRRTPPGGRQRGRAGIPGRGQGRDHGGSRRALGHHDRTARRHARADACQRREGRAFQPGRPMAGGGRKRRLDLGCGVSGAGAVLEETGPLDPDRMERRRAPLCGGWCRSPGLRHENWTSLEDPLEGGAPLGPEPGRAVSGGRRRLGPDFHRELSRWRGAPFMARSPRRRQRRPFSSRRPDVDLRRRRRAADPVASAEPGAPALRAGLGLGKGETLMGQPSEGGRARFATTRWSLVLSAGHTDTRGREALAELCRVYWYPVYAFARRRGESAEDARDLTQSFFTRILEKDGLAGARRERGRFRSYLLSAMKHFMANVWDLRHAAKRGGGAVHLPLDFTAAERLWHREGAERHTPETLFERRWALTLLERGLERLCREYAASGKAELFENLKVYLTGDGAPYRDVADRLGRTEGAVKSRRPPTSPAFRRGAAARDRADRRQRRRGGRGAASSASSTWVR